MSRFGADFGTSSYLDEILMITKSEQIWCGFWIIKQSGSDPQDLEKVSRSGADLMVRSSECQSPQISPRSSTIDPKVSRIEADLCNRINKTQDYNFENIN